MKDKPKRRWYQYSLRSLFILTTLVAIACSWYAYEMQEAAKRRAAIAEIVELGGVIEYYDAKSGCGNPPRWYSWLRTLHGDEHLDNPFGVSLIGLEVTDAELMDLKSLTNLKSLGLSKSQITDAGVVHLKGLTNLLALSLSDTQITDAGLEHLEGLTNLVWLDLTETSLYVRAVLLVCIQ